MKNKTLYNTGVICGLVTLIIGLLIFFIWWAARALFAIDLMEFEVYGFMWSMISFPLAGIGMLLIVITLIINAPRYLIATIAGLILVLFNLPIFIGVVILQKELSQRAYIKIYNLTGQDNVELSLKSSDFKKTLGTIDSGGTLVDFYYPKYLDERGNSSYPTIGTVTMTVNNKSAIHYLILPRIDKGECRKLYITENFQFTVK